jgi:hypothetical protein
LVFSFSVQLLLAQEPSKKLPIQFFATTDAYKIYDCHCSAKPLVPYSPVTEIGGSIGISVPVYKNLLIGSSLSFFNHKIQDAHYHDNYYNHGSIRNVTYYDRLSTVGLALANLQLGYMFKIKKIQIIPYSGITFAFYSNYSSVTTISEYYDLDLGESYPETPPNEHSVEYTSGTGNLQHVWKCLNFALNINFEINDKFSIASKYTRIQSTQPNIGIEGFRYQSNPMAFSQWSVGGIFQLHRKGKTKSE